MPEYLALIHHHNLSTETEPEPVTVDDLEIGFLDMERRGIARMH